MRTKSQDIFRKRNISYTLFFVVIIAVYYISATVTDFTLADGLASFPNAAVWLGKNFIPDAKAFDRLPKILESLFSTILLSVAVTVVSGIFAFTFALFGSNIVKGRKLIKKAVRMTAAFFRNVPDIVWAMLLLFSFGQSEMTGFIALSLTTFGMLTRSFIETIDEASSASVEALEATGASFPQIVFQAIIPSTIAGIITWILYMVETNIRASTVVGILTATGIGYLFDLYYKRLDYGSVSLITISIVVVVIFIEAISNKIRRVIL